jgi:CHAT domain-containing protein
VLGDAKHILVAADGEINLLPFQVLPRGDEGYLIDERRFTYLSCGRDLARLPGLDGHDGNAGVSSIVVADPDYDALIGHAETPDRGSELADRCRRPLVNVREPLGRLPWSRVEGERIARLLPAAHLWTDAGASKSRLQRDCHSPRVLHLATHGRFVTRSELVSPPIEPFAFSLGHNAMAVPDAYLDNPLTRSGLALAGFNCDHGQGDQWDGIDGGLLTADEVAGLDLRRTELAVVSACDTGIGEVACGEGVFGLRRAFQLAGAKSLVMTLWEVDDLATAILMERFYRCLVPDGCTPSEALCRAQQELRQLTVADLREEWLCARTIHRVSAGNGELTAKLAQLAAADSKVRPFCAPDVWGAYICQTCMP